MKRRIALASQIFALSCLAGSALASDLFGVEFDAPTPLYSVNQSNGALSAIGPTGFDHVGDLTSDPLTGTLWGIKIDTKQLLKINPLTGAAAVAANLITPDDKNKDMTKDMTSIAFDPVTRKLYGNTTIAFGATADRLYMIDPATGNTTLIGPIGFQNVFALGFDQNGALFGIADETDQLISISPSTGAGTLIANMQIGQAFDIASRPQDNAMFLADSETHSLYTLNTSNGALTSVGPYGSDTNVGGLAFLGQVPEPSTYLALGLGLTMLALVRRRIAL